MLGQMASDLKSYGRLSGTFFTKDKRGGGCTWVAVDFFPAWVVATINAMLLEDRVSLSVLFGEGVATDPVVFQKLLDFHSFDLLAAGRRSVMLSPWRLHGLPVE